MKDGTYKKTVDGFVEAESNFGYWVASAETTPEDLSLGDYLGVWTDPETGKTWYDKTHFIEDLGTALILAREWKQLAIWDNRNNKAIPMNPNY
jgi:hypothetical protein